MAAGLAAVGVVGASTAMVVVETNPEVTKVIADLIKRFGVDDLVMISEACRDEARTQALAELDASRARQRRLSELTRGRPGPKPGQPKAGHETPAPGTAPRASGRRATASAGPVDAVADAAKPAGTKGKGAKGAGGKAAGGKAPGQTRAPRAAKGQAPAPAPEGQADQGAQVEAPQAQEPVTA